MRTTLLAVGVVSMMMLVVNGCSTSNETSSGGELIDESVVEAGTANGDDGQLGDQVIYEDPMGFGGVGGDATTSIDSSGAMVIGDPNANPNAPYDPSFAGPRALRDNNTIFFRYDSDQIQDEYVSVMQAHAQYLRDNPDSRIIIEGHTDERGTPEYNIALGERRARSVARYMQNLGVDVNQLSIVSYGEEKPVDPGHAESSWQKNRRAVINY